MSTKQPNSLLGELMSSFSGLPLWKRLSSIAVFLLVVTAFHHALGQWDSLAYMVGPIAIVGLSFVSAFLFCIFCLVADFIFESLRYEREYEQEQD